MYLFYFQSVSGRIVCSSVLLKTSLFLMHRIYLQILQNKQCSRGVFWKYIWFYLNCAQLIAVAGLKCSQYKNYYQLHFAICIQNSSSKKSPQILRAFCGHDETNFFISMSVHFYLSAFLQASISNT